MAGIDTQGDTPRPGFSTAIKKPASILLLVEPNSLTLPSVFENIFCS